jgi:hypothetical protein
VFQKPFRYQISLLPPNFNPISGTFEIPLNSEVVTDSGDPTPGQRLWVIPGAVPMPFTVPTVAVHDRNGAYFYNIELPSSDRVGYFTNPGPLLVFLANFNYTSYSAYGSQDPTIPVGMPLNEALGAQTTLANTTRPLFYALVAVQNEKIPDEELPP